MNELASLYGPAYHDGIIAAVILLAVIFVALLIQKALFSLLERLLSNKNEGIVSALLRRAQAPAGFALPLLAINGLARPPTKAITANSCLLYNKDRATAKPVITTRMMNADV